MMYSQNGYVANDRTLIASYTIPGTTIRIALRKGDASVVLLWLLEQYNKYVEPLRKEDTGGYAERVIRGGVSLSNHASGTAVDTRWRDHPLGKGGTFNTNQLRTIRRILNALDGVVRWGGDYHGRKDEMHFEVIASPDKLARVANLIRADRMPFLSAQRKPTSKRAYPAYPGHPLRQGAYGVFVKRFQEKMHARGWARMRVDGNFGPVTAVLVKEFQREKHLVVDGVVGPKTWKAIFTAPI